MRMCVCEALSKSTQVCVRVCVKCRYIEKQTGTSYVYARLVLGATGRVACGATIHSPVADQRVAHVDVGHRQAVREGVLAGLVGGVSHHGLVVQRPGDGRGRGSLGGAHEREGLPGVDHSLAEGRHDAGRPVWRQQNITTTMRHDK